MHIALSVLAEELARHGDVKLDVCSYERRLGISGVTGDLDQASGSTLLVVEGGMLPSLVPAPQHVLAVLSSGQASPELDAPELAFVRTDLPFGAIYGRLCEVMVSLSNWDSRVLEAIAARQDVSAVLAIAAERLTNPIALFDSKGALVAYAGSLDQSAEHTIWEDVLAHRYSPIEYYTHDEQVRIAREMRTPWPFVFTPKRDPDHRYLTRGLFVDGRLFGTIGMVDVNAPITSGQEALAELVSDRLRLALSLRLGAGPAENESAYLLRSVLNGNKADRGLVSYHLRQLGWGTSPTLWLMACENLEGESDSYADATRLARISRVLHNGLCIQYDQRIVVLVANRDPSCNEKLAELLRRMGMRAVASEPFHAVSEARRAYEKCDLGLRATTNVEPSPSQIRYPELFNRVLVNAIDPALDARVLCDQTVLSLAAQGYGGDIERGCTLVRELHAYLMNGCNALLTARQLYLHRNTLLYHMQQVEELLGAKLTDMSPARRLELIVSCLVASQS